MLLLLSLLICFVSSQPGPGIQVPFAWQDLLLIINRERQFWNIPLIDYDEDVAKIAAFTCSQCAWTDVRPAAERQKMLCDLKGLPLGDINVDRYQTVGENRAASAGVNATPSPAIWLNRADWTCADNSCKSGATCGEYTQAIWNNTLYMGCGKCHCNISSPEPQQGPEWTFLVCNFVEAGNFAGKHPLGEGAVKDAACGHTYSPLPPPQPPACDTRKCTDPATCPSPLTAATCNATSGNWEIRSAKAADFAPTVYLGCGLTIESFTANAGDKLRVSVCGKISVTGTTTFNGNPTVDLEFQDIAGLAPGKYQPFFETAAPISGGVFASATAQSVWSPSELLCAQAITGSETSYVLLHDCLDLAVTPQSPLPDGGTTVAGGQSTSSEVVRSSVAGSGGDMNDPDLQTLPKKNLDGTLAPAVPSPLVPEAPTTPSNESGGNTLPGWAIFLIVLACLIVIVVIIVIIVLLTSSSGAESF